jgi:hypothetical protein
MKRKKIYVDVNHISIYDIEGSLDTLIKRLETTKKNSEEQNLLISLETDFVTNEQEYVIYYYRDETDKEFNKRKLQKKKQREKDRIQKEKHERKIYERLKKKFEG